MRINNSDNAFFPCSRILTIGQLFFLIIVDLALITTNVFADVVVQYLDDAPTGVSGNDVGIVSNTGDPSSYNIIKISNTDVDTATHNQSVTNLPSSYTVQSATDGAKQTVTAGNLSLYSLPVSEYQINFKDLNYQGNESVVGNYGAFMRVENGSTININLDNVSYTGFKTNYSGGVFEFMGSSSDIKIITSNTVSFINNAANNTNASSQNDYSRGGAIRTCNNNLEIDSENIIFKGNSAYRYGAAIQGGETGTIKITGANITFDSNSVANNDGGAIQTNGTIIINGKDSASKITFSNNSAKNIGGALSIQTSVNFSTGSFYFDSNKLTASYTTGNYGGGAIDTPHLSIQNAMEVSFTNNQSLHYGGAINITTDWNSSNPGSPSKIEAEKIVFDSNTASGWGGAVHSLDSIDIVGNKISFTNNESLSGYSSGDGGAIRNIGYCTITGSGNNSEVTFQNNFATRLGGAISGYYLSMSSFDSIRFINNKSGKGGVFYGFSAAFEGDGVSASFIGNTATNQGNDIYLTNPISGHSILSFNDNGTYYFDGGIYLDPTNAETIIDKASVTIAGRVNDTTNKYQLRKATLSNGGKLITNLDYINKIEGTQITFSDSVSIVELTNALMNQAASIKSSTGNGTILLEYLAASGNVQNESLVISSGRIDAKGCMAANVSVEANTTFSPGNSVGSVNIDGDFKLTGDLLMEVDGTGADILSCDTFTMNDGTVVLNWQNDEIPFFSTLDIIISESTDLSDVYDNLVENIDFSTSPTVEQLYNDGYIKVSLVGDNKIVRLSIDRNAVPEPSTWALMALGAIGLMYWRKRVRN